MGYNLFKCIIFLPLIISCKKEQTKDIFSERYPSEYVSVEWRYNPPYVKMFTRNGEIKNETLIQEYLIRERLINEFIYQQSVKDAYGTHVISLLSEDSIQIFYNYDPVLQGAYKMETTNKKRHFTGVEKKSKNISAEARVYKVKRAISLQKWAFEMIPDLPIGEYGKYEWIPEVQSYKIDSNLLSIPYVTFRTYEAGGLPQTFPMEFDPNCYQTMSPTDTLLIQEFSLILKRR